MSNGLLYNARAANAYRELTRPQSRVGALCCTCSTPQLRGYLVSPTSVANFRGYQLRKAVRASLHGLAANATERPVLLPISDKVAIANAIKVFSAANAARMAGFGDTAQMQNAASLSASGAKIGSVIPGIGTVIGAVVGAAVGFFLGKSKPPRPTTAQKQECVQYLSEYMGAASENPNTPIPLDETALKQVNWCLQALYGASDIRNRDPRYFDGNFVDLMKIAKEAVQRIYDTPVGGIVNISETANKIGKQTFRSAGLSFTNPPFTDLKMFTRSVFTRVAMDYCKQTAGKGAGGCETFFGRPEYQRLFYDMLGYAARTLLPNISEADLRAASAVAQTVSGTSAKDVVTAVEQVIKRNVQRDETAALLAPTTGPALPVTPIPSAPLAPVVTAPLPVSLPSPQITPVVTPFPMDSFVPRSPLSPLDPMSPLSPLTTRDQVTTATSTATSSNLPYYLAGGALAAMLLLRRRRKRR